MNKKKINKRGSVAEETQDQRTGWDKLIFFLEMWYEDSAIPKHGAIIEIVCYGIAALGWLMLLENTAVCMGTGDLPEEVTEMGEAV